MKLPLKNTLFLLFSCICLNLNAQTTQPSTLLREGDLAYENENFELARQYYIQHLDALIQTKAEDSLIRDAYTIIEETYWATNDVEGVESFYLKEIGRMEGWKSSNPKLYVLLKTKLGSIYSTGPKFKDKESYLLELVAEAEELLGTKHEYYAISMNIMGSYYTLMGNLDKAEDYLIQVLTYWKATNPKSERYSFALNNLGLNYLYKGEYEMAEPYMLRALPIIEATKGRTSEVYAQVLNNLAGVYWNTGRYEEAANSLRESIEIRSSQMSETHPKYLQSLNGLAAIYLKALNYDKAIEIFEKLHKTLEELGQTETGLYAIVLNNLGSAYNEVDNFEAALKCFDQSMKLSYKVYGKEHPESAIALLNKASALVNLKRHEEALPLFIASKRIRLNQISERNPKISLVYNKIALCQLAMGNKEDALLNVTKAFESNTKELNLKAEVSDLLKQLPKADFFSSVRATESYTTLLKIVAELADQEDYLRCLKISMNYLTQLKSQQSFDSDKLTTLSSMAELSEDALGILSKMPKAVDQAFHLIESNKAMLIADALRAKALSAFGDLPDSLILKGQALKKEQAELKKQLIELSNDSLSLVLKQALNENNQATRNYQAYLKTHYPKFYKNQYSSQTIDLNYLKTYLSANSLLLQYYVGEEKLYIVSMDYNAELQFYEKVIAAAELNELVKAYRESLSDYKAIVEDPKAAYQKYSSSAKELYDVLIAPLKEELQGKDRLLIIPDKMLGHIPFEALLGEKAAPYYEGIYQELPYLVKDYGIYYNYSARLVLNEREQTQEQKGTKGFLGFAASYSKETTAEDLYINARSPRLKGLRSSLQDLPAAKEELQTLQDLFKGDFFFDGAANEQNFKNLAADYQVIHLAMHGLLDRQYPIRSALAFTENGDTTEDNFLQAYEISHMHLNADLVVLSACETGFGNFQQGEGVLSLARSFMYAGVPALLVSLWQVNDQSTAIIMQLYYDQLAKGKNKVEALRQAKLKYLDQSVDIAQHPAFWAAFVQLGSDKPVEMQQKGETSYWWIYFLGAGGGLLVLGLLVFRRSRKRAV